MKKTTIILGIVIVVLLAGVYVLKSGNNEGSNTAVVSPTPSPSPTVLTAQAPTDWKTYQNADFGFEFKYPPQAVVCTFRSGDGPNVLDLTVRLHGDCKENAFTGDILITMDNLKVVNDNVMDTAPVGPLDPSKNPNLKQVVLDGLPGYENVTTGESGKLEYWMGFSHQNREMQLHDTDHTSLKDITSKLVGSFRFNTEKYPR